VRVILDQSGYLPRMYLSDLRVLLDTFRAGKEAPFGRKITRAIVANTPGSGSENFAEFIALAAKTRAT
jgi:hypothetical protein